MPALVLFGHRTVFAGDDLRFFSVAHGVYRVFQLCVTIAVSFLVYRTIAQDENEIELAAEICDGYGRLSVLTSNGLLIFHFYMTASFLLCIFSLGVLCPMFYVSGLGSPTDVAPRRPLYSICYCDLVWVNFLRVAACTVGALVVYIMSSFCHCMLVEQGIIRERGFGTRVCPATNPVVTLLSILFVSHCFDAGMVALTFFWFTFNKAKPRRSLVSSERKCRICLRCCVGCASVSTCCLFGGPDALLGDYADFSKIFSNYLSHNDILDVTPSDMIVGLHMVRREQRQRNLETKERLARETTTEHNSNRPVDPISRQVLMRGQFSSDTLLNFDGDAVESSVVQKGGSDNSTPSQTEAAIDRVEHIKDDDNADNDDDNEDLNEMDIEEQYQSTEKREMEILSRYHPRDVYLLAEAAHFMPIAQSAYTWVSYMLEHPFSGWLTLPYLIFRRCACLYPSKPKGKISGDYLWQPHTVALEAISGHTESDIVYATYYDSGTRIPYCILLDHDWKTVVLAIRGTITLEGVFKDVSILPKELTYLGSECGFDGKGFFCHTGMLKSSEWVLQDLKRHGKLDALLTGDYKDYRLRIIGHSLGAGVASILSILLRPKYPLLRCLAFSPPGCVMSRNLADECRKWTNSYIVGDDIVPRMSIEGFEELRDGILEMICRIKIPKYQVTQKKHEDDLDASSQQTGKSLQRILYAFDEARDSKFKQQVHDFWKWQADLKEKNKSQYIELCPPGAIIELFKTTANNHRKRTENSSSSAIFGGFGSKIVVSASREIENNDDVEEDDVEEDQNDPLEQFTARWADRSEFRRIIVSPHLLADHDPIGVKKRLQKVAIEQFGLAPPFCRKDLQWSEP